MSSKKAPSKSPAKATKAGHPTWIEMIKECIGAHREDARIGVSRPQIKKYVESKYKLEIGPAQISQLSKALSSGSEKGIFILPKGPSGRVKLAPKNKASETTSGDENKPAPKVKSTAKSIVKPKTAKTATATVTTIKKPVPKPRTTATSKAASKPSGTARTNAAAKKAPAVKTAPKPTPTKKTLPGKSKSASSTKKATVPSKRETAKKLVTGNTTSEKVKTAAKKTPAKKASTKSASKSKSSRSLTSKRKPAQKS